MPLRSTGTLVGFVELVICSEYSPRPHDIIPKIPRRSYVGSKHTFAVKGLSLVGSQISSKIRLDKSEQIQQEYNKYMTYYSGSDRLEVATETDSAAYWSAKVDFKNCLMNSLLPYWATRWWKVGTSPSNQ